MHSDLGDYDYQDGDSTLVPSESTLLPTDDWIVSHTATITAFAHTVFNPVQMHCESRCHLACCLQGKCQTGEVLCVAHICTLKTLTTVHLPCCLVRTEMEQRTRCT